jgi:hypothetical protein
VCLHSGGVLLHGWVDWSYVFPFSCISTNCSSLGVLSSPCMKRLSYGQRNTHKIVCSRKLSDSRLEFPTLGDFSYFENSSCLIENGIRSSTRSLLPPKEKIQVNAAMMKGTGDLAARCLSCRHKTIPKRSTRPTDRQMQMNTKWLAATFTKFASPPCHDEPPVDVKNLSSSKEFSKLRLDITIVKVFTYTSGSIVQMRLSPVDSPLLIHWIQAHETNIGPVENMTLA